MEIIYLIIGILVGAAVGWLAAKSRFNVPVVASQDALEADKKNAVLSQQLADTRASVAALEATVAQLRSDVSSSHSESAHWKANFEAAENRLKEEKSEHEKLQTLLKEQFSNIANEVVLHNSKRIQEEHKSRLDDVLSPLREKIDKFESQVKITHEERIREHQSLKEQLAQLQTMNKSIGDEARNLVTALKGQTKTQGNWGEMILEKVLERSGLMKGREYSVQASMTNDEGRRLQPDVIINLPEGRSLVVDSKVSLIAYERYSSADTDELKEAFLKEHIASLRKHVRDLSGKSYQNLYAINTLDFVLLFVPIEPAFSIAVESDPELFNEAFERNIVIVTTSTLLATLRTIASIWRLEYQNKNSLEIARQAGDLYDKLSAHLDDLISVGGKMKDADKAYEAAMNKLYSGKGNLIARVENLKKLGLKTTKQVNQKLLDRTEGLDDSSDVAIPGNNA
ncbi:MAG TPA: DNA recombination protein RmuC [Bacteroidia bacterium]|jgi:DNA recombination protein RmuC|nr:DNA recombination protein RmuC [Bacteroidia bacterium]HQF27694.1 DNA recombination protein RmuC [Bacteroidia bacterium]